jgi:hypothetical protein
MELAIVLAGIVLCFYGVSVKPYGYPPPSTKANIQVLFLQMDTEPKVLTGIRLQHWDH